MSGQEIIRKEDIIGGEELVDRSELTPFAKSEDLGSAAYEDKDLFAKSENYPTPQFSLILKKK